MRRRPGAAAQQAQQQLAQQAALAQQQAQLADQRAQRPIVFGSSCTQNAGHGARVDSEDVRRVVRHGRYTLRPGAREKLAKISGIVRAHPGLKLEVEGHTDRIGDDENNIRLSDQRASATAAWSWMFPATLRRLSPGASSIVPFSSMQQSVRLPEQGRRRMIIMNHGTYGAGLGRRTTFCVSSVERNNAGHRSPAYGEGPNTGGENLVAFCFSS